MKKIIDLTKVGLKDENGIYVSSRPTDKIVEPKIEDISIDSLLHRSFRTLHGIIRAIEVDVNSGAPSRETIMNLRDVMNMLKELKKEEKDFLDSLSDDDLLKLNNNANSK